MPDNDSTRRYDPTRKLDTDTTQKTRLVRRSDSSEDKDTDAHSGQPKTRIAGRPNRPANAEGKAPVDPDSLDRPVVGWLVVVSGPGRGKFAPVLDGLNSVGRGDDQSAQLDFGDDSISRSDHAYISYDHMDRSFKIQMGGKANLVRLNKAPVLQPIDIKTGDRISIGRTELAFVSFCVENFDWQESQT